MTRLTRATPGRGCPTWLRFLGEVTGNDRELIAYLARVAGYCLTGRTCEHAFFFLHGAGANGKSVLLAVLQEVLGSYATTAPLDSFMAARGERHSTDLAGLRGARLVSVTETEPGRTWAESRIKAITGGDRVVQAAVLQVLEPIFEAEFLTVSYGFRPGRACRDALEHIRNAIRPTGVKTQTDWPRSPYQWVIEGDIKGCFDNIDHHHVLTRLRRRVADRKVCRLVRAFLKAGVLTEEAFLRTPTGTPQGGVLSPLLANITLSAIEERYATYVAPRKTRDGAAYARPGDAVRKFRHYERKAGRPVFLPIRYADDFVVLVAGSEEQTRAEKEDLAAFLANELKLTLSPEKTRVTALSEGFIFLGHRVRLRWDDRWGYWPRLEIPKDRIMDLRRRIKHLTTRARRNLPLGR